MVPRLIKEYRRKHPRIQFTLLVQHSGELLMEELVAGSIRSGACPSRECLRKAMSPGVIFWTKNY